MTKRLACSLSSLLMSLAEAFLSVFYAQITPFGNDFRRSLALLAPNGAIICARHRKKRLSFGCVRAFA